MRACCFLAVMAGIELMNNPRVNNPRVNNPNAACFQHAAFFRGFTCHGRQMMASLSIRVGPLAGVFLWSRGFLFSENRIRFGTNARCLFR
jgi:hypothetical protein